MSVLLLIATTTLLVLAGPAFADCNQEIENLGEAVTQAETGASSTSTGLPATEHQKEVLGSQDGKQGETTGANGPGHPVAPISPDQQQVLEAGQANKEQPAQLLAEAGDMVKAGDEEGCIQNVAPVEDLLGMR
jgi:hypothetical protein